MSEQQQHHRPTRSEIIELAIAEGHDADIPSNAGSIRQIPSNTPAPPHKYNDPEKTAPLAFDKDIEKVERGSISSGEDVIEETSEDDPNIVFWDGPDDPQNPMNWSAQRKWGTVVLVSAVTFLTPLASSMFAPGVPKVME